MSENLTLHFSRNSIASQAVLMLIKILKIEIQNEDVDLSGELHPVNKVPVLVHGELILTEPRVILGYLVDLFKPDDSLYPRELKKRAMIDQRLFYDAAVVYPCIMNIIVKISVISSIPIIIDFFIATGNSREGSRNYTKVKRCACCSFSSIGRTS